MISTKFQLFKTFFKELPIAQKWVFSAWLAFVFGIIAYVFANMDHLLWDFNVYYSGALVYLNGQNIYDTQNLISSHEQGYELPFMYPPIIVYLFTPFSFLKYELAQIVYFLIKLLAIIALFRLWLKFYVDKKRTIVFLVFATLIFNAAIFKDLTTGNISVFEQLGIWWALYFFLKGRLKPFVILILIVSFFKILPIIFLLFIPFSKEKKKWTYFVLGGVGFACFLGLNALVEPELTLSYITNFTGNAIEEGGIGNASSLEFMKHTGRLLEMSPASSIPIITYLIFIITVLIVSIKKIRNFNMWESEKARMLGLYCLCFVIILVLPRFKDYSYIFGIIPVFYTLVLYKERIGLIFLVAVCCVSVHNLSIPIFSEIYDLIWNYYSLVIVFICWLLLIREIGKGRAEK
jgi:hypothetical protein